MLSIVFPSLVLLFKAKWLFKILSHTNINNKQITDLGCETISLNFDSSVSIYISYVQPQQLSLSAQEAQLQQLQMLQQQLVQQTRFMQEPQQAPTQPIIDGNLLAQISALTSTLLIKSKDDPTAKPAPQPAFDKVRLVIGMIPSRFTIQN